MPWVIGVCCWASAAAIEPSERTLAATAALIGAAMFALIRLIASRFGSSAPCCLAMSALLRPFLAGLAALGAFCICFATLVLHRRIWTGRSPPRLAGLAA